MEASGIKDEPVADDMQEDSDDTAMGSPPAHNVRLGGEFKAGDEIMTCDPMVKCLSRSSLESRCYYCFKEKPEIECADCLVPRYCDSKCMSLDYLQAHSFECALWKSSHHFRQYCLDDDGRLLMLRLYALMESIKNLPVELWPSSFSPSRSFDEVLLRPEVNVYTVAGMDTCHVMVDHISAIFPKPGLDAWSLNSLYGVVKQKREPIPELTTDNSPICSPTFNTVIGWGIYVIPALLEHDCKPNVALLHTGSDLVIRALGDIGLTDMPRISYLRGHYSWRDRSVLLQCHYNTRCCCYKCTHRTDRNVDMMLLHRLLGEIFDLWRRKIIWLTEWADACQKLEAIVAMFREMYEEYDPRVTNLYATMAAIGVMEGVERMLVMDLLVAAARHAAVTYGLNHYKFRILDAWIRRPFKVTCITHVHRCPNMW